MGNLFDLGADPIGHSLGNDGQLLPDTELDFAPDSHISNLESLSGEYAFSLLEEINLSHEVDYAVHSFNNYARDEVQTIFKCLASDSKTTLCREDKSDVVISNFDHLSTDPALTGLHEAVWQDNSHNDDGLDPLHSDGRDWDADLGLDRTDVSDDWQVVNDDSHEHQDWTIDPDTSILEDDNLGDLQHGLENDTFHHYEQAASGFDYPHAFGAPDLDTTYWQHQETDYTCAVVSQQTILNELTGHHYTEGELLQEATANGWCTDTGTPINSMHKLLEAHGVETEQSAGHSLDDITAQLAQGHKVVVAINAEDIWHYENAVGDVVLRDYGHIPLNSPDHAVVVTGIDYTNPAAPMVILNDSGTPNGAAEMVPAGVFMVAWEHSNNYMVNTTGRVHASHPATVQTAMLGDNYENAAYNASWADYYHKKAEYDASYGY
jgi:Peptidase_C39 like family